MKILITHSYFLHFDAKEAETGKPYPPLAPLALAAWLERDLDAEVVVYDVMFDRTVDGAVAAVAHHRPDVLIFYDDDFNFLTKMCLRNMRDAVFAILETIERPPLIIAHGSDASDQADDYLARGVDVVAHRNAEKTLLALLRAWAEERGPSAWDELDGISWRRGTEVVRRPQIRTNLPLDAAPAPAWDKIDLDPYRRMWRERHGAFSLNVSTSHGCPYRCNWCAKPLYGRTYKAHDPVRAAREFVYLHRELGADWLWVTDDIFALKPGWIDAFADELARLGTTVPYKCQNRADLITESLAAGLARSGCREVWLGVESGSQKILDAMDKDETVETIRTATARLKTHGIEVGFFLQYGYLGEDYDDIRKTLRLVRECLPEHIGVSVSYPLKDTPFYDTVAAQLGEKRNWDDSGDLALMYEGTYPPDFYRALHRYTHHYFGFVSLFRPQPLRKRLRRLAAQYRHLPGMIKYKRMMNACR